MLTNQEHAMKEYLRRQQVKMNPKNPHHHVNNNKHSEHCQLQVEAEKHIRQYSPGPVRRAEVQQSLKVSLYTQKFTPNNFLNLVTAE